MESSERSPFDVTSEKIARSFHENYEKFAPEFGWQTENHRGVWDDLPEKNRVLMIAVVKKLLIDGIIEPGTKIAVN